MARIQYALVAAAGVVAAAAGFDGTCSEMIRSCGIDQTKVLFSVPVTAGTNLTFPGLDPSCGAGFSVVPADICRVGLNVSTSARSDIIMEVWLPRNWTGRFLATGNGGINGCLGYDDMGYGVSLGFATTGSNNGHSGQNGTRFLHNEDVIKDFAWRSLHTSAVVGKRVTASFYGKPHTKAYYLGCSTGGRQGFKAAQDFPADFDGIVAGAPAVNFNNLTSWSGSFHSIIASAGPDGYPAPAAWPAVDAEILRQCNLLDGAADGILEDASQCDFRPEALICPAGTAANATTCISAKQAATLRAVFSDLRGLGNALVYPRMQPGPTLTASIYAIYAAAQFLYTDQWFKYAVYGNPSLDTSFLTPEDWAFAWRRNAGDSNSWSGDLAAFAGRRGKLLHYHGQVDTIISSSTSDRYYRHVADTMGLSPAQLDGFYRFFRISGMGHCGGGPGASAIGNQLASVATLNPEGNVLTAMVRWVEDGVAPQSVTGTRWVNGSRALGVDYTRRHCKYPARNVYVGPGPIKDPDAWKCV